MSALANYLLLGSVFSRLLLGQSVSVAPSETDRNTPGSFSLALESPRGRALVAIQWEFATPAALVIKAEDIAVGQAAQAAGKSLTCARKDGSNGGARYACILQGGQTVIGNGPIAVVQYRVQVDVKGAPVHVAIEKVAAVSADQKSVSLPNTEAIITIRD